MSSQMDFQVVGEHSQKLACLGSSGAIECFEDPIPRLDSFW